MQAHEIENLEMGFLLEGLQRVYGYDFREYSETSMRRRIVQWLAEEGFDNASLAQARLLREPGLFRSLLQGITVNVTEMFRDPAFFQALRTQVVPFLKTYPFVKIWHAGCASGEEAYSMAILLDEEGMAGRYRLYATDIDAAVLERAEKGILSLADMQVYTRNYQQSGGNASFSDYYTARYDGAILSENLRRNIVFAQHNLASDAEFGEMHMVLCRNVMIYFKTPLKERCLKLFDASLLPGGFLCLGTKETLDRTGLDSRYDELVRPLRIYRKRYGQE